MFGLGFGLAAGRLGQVFFRNPSLSFQCSLDRVGFLLLFLLLLLLLLLLFLRPLLGQFSFALLLGALAFGFRAHIPLEQLAHLPLFFHLLAFPVNLALARVLINLRGDALFLLPRRLRRQRLDRLHRFLFSRAFGLPVIQIRSQCAEQIIAHLIGPLVAFVPVR